MSGVDNIRGIDYQVTYSMLKLIQILINEVEKIEGIQFESLSEKEEDMNIYTRDGGVKYIQIKKRVEGYTWGIGDLKEIINKFYNKDREGAEFYFVTDGAANKELVNLKRYLGGEKIDEDLVGRLVSNEISVNEMEQLLKRITITTNYYTSMDQKFPAKLLKERIMSLLQSGAFELINPVEEVYNSIWKYIFEMSQESKFRCIDEITNDIEKLGLRKCNRDYYGSCNIKNIIGRDIESKEILKQIYDFRKVIVSGISGIGKTYVLSKIYDYLRKQGKKAFFIEINNLYEMQGIIKLIAYFLYNVGLEGDAQNFLKSEVANRVSNLIRIVRENEIYIFIDSLDKSSVEVNRFFQQLIKEILDVKLKGAIVISTNNTEGLYSVIDIMKRKILDYSLEGFNVEEIIKIFANNILSYKELEEFCQAIGGYPITIIFLKQLLDKKEITQDEVAKLKELSIESANKEIFNRIISRLDPEEKEVALSCAIFNYPFSSDEIEVAIKSKIKPTYILDKLINKKIVILSGNRYLVHDAIRGALHDMLGKKSIVLHKKLADYYEIQIKQQYKQYCQVKYEAIMKWGYHTENGIARSIICKKLLSINNDLLDALWAINRFGFPFAYSDEDLEQAKDNIQRLKNDGLIVKNINPFIKYAKRILKYKLKKNFNFFDICFLEYLCLSRGISNHLGYIEKIERNEAYDMQGICCAWEHCIEYMPVPIENNDESEKEDYLRILSYRDIQISESKTDNTLVRYRCPIFGHCCPGGMEQASICSKDKRIDDYKEMVLRKSSKMQWIPYEEEQPPI